MSPKKGRAPLPKVLLLGGIAVSLVNFRGPLIGALSKQGYEVVACSAPASPDVIETLRALGAEFKSIPVQRVGLNPFADLKLCFAIAKLLRFERPSVVLAYTAKPVIFCGIVTLLIGFKNFYAMVTGVGYAFSSQTFKQRIIREIVRFLYKIALSKNAGVFFQNPDDEDFFQKQGLVSSRTNTIQINGSGVDLNRFRPVKLPKIIAFSLIARLIVDKGLREFYDAATNLKEKYPHVRFLLAGSLDSNPNSIRREELKRWINEGVIEFYGWLSDVRPFISETQVYVLPSYREGTPRSVLEAMAMSRPVITTDVPGCRETVTDGLNGFLVPPRDSVALEEAMERFILDPTLAPKMGAVSLEIAKTKYDVNKVNALIIASMGLKPIS